MHRSDDWLIGVLSMVADPTLIYQKIKSQKSCESLPTTIHKLNFFDYDKRKRRKGKKLRKEVTMSKTFGQLKAGDNVYVINGSNVDIIRLSVAEPSPTDKNYTWVIFDDYEYSVYSDSTSFYDDMVGDIYCDIDEAMRKMQDICAKALHDYRESIPKGLALPAPDRMYN